MVDDLLDLAKIEAGKVDVKVARFEVADMFGSLRGMLRPLLVNPELALVFHEPAPGLALTSDQGKLSQILRNFISNAIKFTERGAIDVRVVADAASGMAAFTVTDTGLGIEPRHLPLVFEEFSQIENHLQARAKGTGLGLPLCRKLAELLNGEVSARSVPGAGSVFTVTIPLSYATPGDGGAGLSVVQTQN
jgi:signal transduction histidine kinase